jgi:hypothetical protein
VPDVDEVSEGEGFRVTVPVWLLDKGPSSDATEVVTLTASGRGGVLPLFTDPGRAGRFADGLAGRAHPFSLRDPAGLLNVVADCQAQGVQTVGIDLDHPAALRGRLVPIEIVRRALADARKAK